jgi:hypothetical protein
LTGVKVKVWAKQTGHRIRLQMETRRIFMVMFRVEDLHRLQNRLARTDNARKAG